MTILITGAAGFIGSHLADHLVAAGHTVVGVDNFETGRPENFPEAGELVEGDLVDLIADLVDDVEPEVVVHCAASYKDGSNWSGDIRTNALGSALVARACLEHGVRRLVYFQTALCYGNAPVNQPVRIDDALAPESSYAISKTAGERYIVQSGIDYVSFRLANVYGPRNVSGPVPTFFRRLSAGEPCTIVDSRRDFVYVDDLVEVVLRALDDGPSGAYHVSSGHDFAIGELYDAVCEALGVDVPATRIPRPAEDAATILLDPSLTEQTFGWRTTTTLERGVRAAVDWYRENGVGETYTHLALKG